jgi:DNA-binding Xre family transcriptional regulator
MVAYPKYEEFAMANNLDKMIRKSGMSNRQVAEEKGIKPETLSRHKSGAINISRQDAEDYAQILNCLPQQIMYQNAPIPLLGTVKNTEEKGWHVVRDPNANWYSERETVPCIFLNSHFNHHTVALRWQEEIDGHYGWLSNSIFIFSMEKARFNKVDPESIMKNGLIRERDTGRLLLGAVYPNPGKKTFTIYNGDGLFKTEEDIDVEWSAPVLAANLRPDLREAEIVEVKKTEVGGGTWHTLDPAHLKKYGRPYS